MAGMKQDLKLLVDQGDALPMALPRRALVLQRIMSLKHRYAGALTRRVPMKVRNGLHGTTLIKRRVPKLAKPNDTVLYLTVLLATVYVVYSSRHVFMDIPTKLKLMWHTVFAHTGGRNDQERMDNFYKYQADIYDDTRKHLLKGRRTMLRLSAAHVSNYRESSRRKRLVWVDIGGGTGWNIEQMNAFIPVNTFDAIYLVDVCTPLLEIAKKRFASLGWTNVHVFHQDASSFTLPEASWQNGAFGHGSISLVTCSYSLSMIPDFYAVLDRISYLLSLEGGILSVADFYTSGAISQARPSAVDLNRACSRLSRWFWQIWFDFDNITLGPQRREYLEYRFETLKVYNDRNNFLSHSPIRIPYYVWLGRPKCSQSLTKELPAPFSVPETNPGSLFSNAPWRIPYTHKPWHDEMNTFMYSFNWEDPYEDMKFLEPSVNDSLLVITSAGDNALHYAAGAKFKAIHCVDMNPCQGHLLELKMAALKVLPYETVFRMFGSGHIDSFQEILDSRLSPFLSAPCYQFWKTNSDMFASSKPLYMHGHSGYALRMIKALLKSTRRTYDVEQMCNASSLAEQSRIWYERVRPVILSPLVVSLLDNRWFCWRALGVPKNQRNLLLAEGTAYDYIRDTLDPVIKSKLLKDEGYHYLMTLLGRYTSSSCPLYLKEDAYDALKAHNGNSMAPIKIHTDTISGVLRTMASSSLNKAILMDHLDWFSKDDEGALEEIQLLHRALKPGGFILLRSAGRAPWYIKRFSDAGFNATCLNVRESGSQEALDSVNMYASFWKIRKPEEKV